MSSITDGREDVPTTNSLRPWGGFLFNRTKIVCKITLENLGPIGTNSRSLSISSNTMNDKGDCREYAGIRPEEQKG